MYLPKGNEQLKNIHKNTFLTTGVQNSETTVGCTNPEIGKVLFMMSIIVKYSCEGRRVQK